MYKCVTCCRTFLSLIFYNKHQKIHKSEPDLKIVCRYTGCLQEFEKYENFTKHVYRMHKIDKLFDSKNRYFCQQVDCNFKCSQVFSLKKHLNEHLAKEAGKITCPFPNCTNPELLYYDKNSFAVHLSRSHRDVPDKEYHNVEEDAEMIWEEVDHGQSFQDMEMVMESDAVDDASILDDNNDLRCKEDRPECIEDYDSDEDEVSPTREEDVDTAEGNNTDISELEKSDSTRILAEMMLLLSTKNFATESILQTLVQGVGKAFEVSQKRFLSNLQDSNFPEDEKKKIEELYKISFSSFTDPLDTHNGSLRNTYARNKYHNENFNCIEPIEIELGKDASKSGDKKKKHFYHYVPIAKTLTNMLSNKNFRDYCENPRTSKKEGVLFDECDGKVTKNNEFVNEKSRVITILGFQDAFEIVNPLGSSKKKFKLVGVYMIPGNLPPFLRSKVQNLKLILLCREKYIEIYGWDEVLKEMMKDLKLLETDGITFCFEGKKIHYLGTLLAMLGDSLGSHEIGCFCTNFSTSKYFCRYCEITRDKLKAGKYQAHKLRNVDSYVLCCEQAEKQNIIFRGVKSNSVLNALRYYHVCNPGLPPCIAHDGAEGVIPFDFMFGIKFFVTEGWFTFEELNERLENFKFCDEQQVTLPPIKDAQKLTGTASEIRRLLLIFPFLVIDKVQDYEDDVWQMVMHMREVFSLIYAPALSIEQVAFLQEEIRVYLDLRIKCFPTIPLRPKHHFINHYPFLILHFGPLKHMWTLRFESLHSFFKNVIRHCKNFKNITKLLARKHEQLQSVCMTEELYDSTAISDKAVPFKSSNFPDEETRSLISDLVSKGEVSLVCKEVLFRGITYKKNMTICVGKSGFNCYILCTIDEVLMNESRTNLHFLGLRHYAKYSQLFGAFESCKINGSETVLNVLATFEYSQLLSPDPFLKTNIGCTEVYVCKYAPLDTDI